MAEQLEWAWWPGGGNDEGSRRHLLPIGLLPGTKMRLDADLWATAPMFPNRHPIGETVAPAPEFVRYVFLDPDAEHVMLQTKPGGEGVELINSSIGAFISSIGLFATWHSRLVLMIEQSPKQVDPLIEEAVAQVRAVERQDPSRGQVPEFWPYKLRSLARLL